MLGGCCRSLEKEKREMSGNISQKEDINQKKRRALSNVAVDIHSLLVKI